MPAINGVVIGIITDTMDPMGKGRVRVRLPSMPGAATSWAPTCMPFGATAASRPKISDQVVVAFESGDPDRPVVLGQVPN